MIHRPANANAGEHLAQLSGPQRRRLRRTGQQTARFQRRSLAAYRARFR